MVGLIVRKVLICGQIGHINCSINQRHVKVTVVLMAMIR